MGTIWPTIIMDLATYLLTYGIFVMWFLAFHMGLSKPIDPDRVDRVAKSLI